MRKSPRDRRLSSDYLSVQQLQRDSSIFSFEARATADNAPQRYRLQFSGAGFERNSKGEIVVSQHHEVLVEMGAAYPRMIPNLAWQTPIFHPNISNNGVVCLGGYGTHWVPSLTLSEMCTMLWDMIRYKNFDTNSPYNREAALWARQQTKFAFPIDARSIRDRVEQNKQRTPIEADIVFQPTRHQPPTVATPASATSASQPEIIETGIEIVSSRDRRPDRSAMNQSGILFLD